MWDERFEIIMRKHLPYLSGGQPITVDLSLRDFGLDSMGSVAMMADLEREYDIRFVNDALKMETFATPGALWSALSLMRK
jgi:acyl carrier protein